MSLVTPLKRTAIIVTDLNKSLRFYRDVLGLNVWVQGKMGKEVPAIFKLLGVPPGAVRWIILQSEDVDWGMVGLFELQRPLPLRVRQPSLAQANAGEACLVFHTPDVDAVHRGAKRLKLRIVCPPTLLEIAERQVLSKELTLRDPNGVLVQFHPERTGRDDDPVESVPGSAQASAQAQSGAQATPYRCIFTGSIGMMVAFSSVKNSRLACGPSRPMPDSL